MIHSQVNTLVDLRHPYDFSLEPFQIQFMLSPKYDEVTTIARDGCVRAWYWDTVDQADPPEEDPFVELNPVAETCVRILCHSFEGTDLSQLFNLWQ